MNMFHVADVGRASTARTSHTRMIDLSGVCCGMLRDVRFAQLFARVFSSKMPLLLDGFPRLFDINLCYPHTNPLK